MSLHRNAPNLPSLGDDTILVIWYSLNYARLNSQLFLCFSRCAMVPFANDSMIECVIMIFCVTVSSPHQFLSNMASQRGGPSTGAAGGPAQRPNGATQGKICQFKLVLLGESAVGKSSLVLRFVKGQFHEYQESTIGGGLILNSAGVTCG